MIWSQLRSLYLDLLTLTNLISLPAPSTIDCPFSVYASRDIQDLGLRNAAPLHEYLVVSYKDTTASGVENYMLLERWGSDFTPSNNKTKPKELVPAIDLVLFSVEKYLETSDRLQSVANDRILISYRRMPADITHIERGQSIAMGCKVDNIEAAPNAWLYQRVKNLMTEKVKGKYGSAAIKMKYDIAWEEFEASIRAQHAKNLLPLQKERLARQAAEAHAEVLESEYEQMKEAIARLQGEGLGAT
ncbi:hypothetical protein B0H10DRAFT_1984909 [Mycena sp. CBHHK59/15]|nr:hypothetical protein B0H10DRAFT_1984909 [Mycena sp. CBHHK59/15]